MAKQRKQYLKAFEEYLRHLVETSPYRPFTTEQIERILKSFGIPKDLSQYRDEKRIEIMKEIHAQQLAQAEANFRNPSQMHSLGELFESTLTIKNIFISQLAQEMEIAVEEIEGYIENRPPAKPLTETQLVKLVEMTSLAIEEIRRIANETVKRAETHEKIKSVPTKSRRPYPTATGYSAASMIREKN